MLKHEKKFVNVISEKMAREKISEWYADKQNLSITSCIPSQQGDKGYEVVFSYDELEESIQTNVQGISEFSVIWDTEVKKLAQTCVKEPELVRLMMQNEGYEPTEEEKVYLKKVSEKYKDPCGMYYISDMIWRIEHALADGRQWQASLAITNVFSCLDSSDYLKNVFQGDATDDEYQTMMALRDGLKKLINC